MNLSKLVLGGQDKGEVVAHFGAARLVKRLDSKFELRGGTKEDTAAAREWISLFLHEAVLAPPGRQS